MNKKNKAILFMVLSATSFSFMQLAVKLSMGMPMMQQVFMRNFVAVFIGYYMVKKSHTEKILGKRENQLALMIRAIFGYLGVIMFFYSSRHMRAADATLLQRSSPFFIILFSAIFLNEKLTRVQITALVTAFIGALFIIRPRFDSAVLPAVVGICSAMFTGAGCTAIAYLKGKEDNGVIIFYFSVVSTLLSFPFMMMDYVVPDLGGWIVMFVIAIFASLGQIFLTTAYKNAPAGEVSIYNYSGIVSSALLGYFVLGERLDVMSIIGMIIIIGAALYLFLKNRYSV